jgi:hypothetical protein
MNIEQENEFHKKALEEWNRKAEERLDTINALKAALEKIAEADSVPGQIHRQLARQALKEIVK